jgi:hypothetical protein
MIPHLGKCAKKVPRANFAAAARFRSIIPKIISFPAKRAFSGQLTVPLHRNVWPNGAANWSITTAL